MGLAIIALLPILCTVVHADIRSPSTEESLSSKTLGEVSEKTLPQQIREILGITYFSYFFGPGLHRDNLLFPPNQLGYPDNDGIYFQNQLSVRYKFSSNMAIDFQSRFKILVNNYTENAKFSPFRWEAPRIGLSGVLLSGETWSLAGAINTDFPYFFPEPFSGYQARRRTTLVTPGMFASLKIEPKNSRWSLFSVVSPRYFLYADRTVAEPQYINAGFLPGNKPELILSFQPTINYKVSVNTKLTLGTTLDYRKLVVSNWNAFDATLISNGNSKTWRLYAIPVNVGLTYKFSNEFTIFPFISAFPIAAQRVDAATGERATLLQTTAFGMWLSGTLF